MIVRSIVVGIFCVAALSSWAGEIIVADDIQVPAGGITINVDAGDTKIYTGTISGTGPITKTGEGMLVLSAANTYSGKLSFSAGVVRADAQGAFGTGQVEVGKGAGGVYLNAQGATFPNKFHKLDGNALFIRFMADATVTGEIVADYAIDSKIQVDENVVGCFEGVVTGRIGTKLDPKRGFDLSAVAGTLIFKSKLLMPVLHDWRNPEKTSHGTVELWKSSNTFDGNGIDFAGLDYICRAENVLNNAILNRAGNRGYKSELNLNGNNQKVRDFNYSATDVALADDIGGTISTPTDAPATLTIEGSGENGAGVCNFEIDGAVSIALDADPTYTLSFLNRRNQTTGNISVTSGKFVVEAGTASFLNVPTVTVDGSGELELRSATAFNRKLVQLHLGGNGLLSIQSGLSVTFNKVFVNNVEVAPGRYTYENAPLALKEHLAEGSGTLVVRGGGLVLLFR